MYTGDITPDDQSMFITEKRCFNDLMTGLASSCSECSIRSCWRLDSVIQVVNLLCFSSRVFYLLIRRGMSSELCSVVATVGARRDLGQALACLGDIFSSIRSKSDWDHNYTDTCRFQDGTLFYLCWDHSIPVHPSVNVCRTGHGWSCLHSERYFLYTNIILY